MEGVPKGPQTSTGGRMLLHRLKRKITVYTSQNITVSKVSIYFTGHESHCSSSVIVPVSDWPQSRDGTPGLGSEVAKVFKMPH